MVSSISSKQTTSTTTDTSNSSSQLTLKTFINLLVAQMQHQDPTEPMKDSEYISQLTNLGTLQGLDELNTSANIEKATGMIGKTVTAPRPNANSSDSAASQFVTGQVTSVNMRSGKYYLSIKESATSTVEVEMKSVQTVKN